MKKLCLYMLALLCLSLSACGAKNEEKLFEDFSAGLRQRNDLSFIGDLRAEYDDRTVEFQLQYKDTDSGSEITVLRPELVAGVSVELKEGASVLEYNSLVIDTGPLDEKGLSPLTALPTIVNALRNGWLDSVRAEDGELVFNLIPEDGLTAEVWFDPASMTPCHAELICEDTVRIFCDIESWR